MKCNQSRPGFELVSPSTFPTTITITPEAPPIYTTCTSYKNYLWENIWVVCGFYKRVYIPVYVWNICMQCIQREWSILLTYVYIVNLQIFCLHATQTGMNRASNETRSHLWRLASSSLLTITPPKALPACIDIRWSIRVFLFLDVSALLCKCW